MALRKYFDPLDREWVLSWVDSEEVAEAFCGLSRVTPLVFEDWYNAPDQLQFVYEKDDGEPVAYGEVWLSENDNELEISHLIVSNEFRSQGHGADLVRSLLQWIRMEKKAVKKVWARVDTDFSRGADFLQRLEFREVREVPDDWSDEYRWFLRELS